MLEAVKEILFIYYLLKGMELNVKIRIDFRCDNVGAIFMAENSSSGVRTHHIDASYHVVREHGKDRLINIVFVKSSDNDAEICGKGEK
jgi:hypothetical protein